MNSVILFYCIKIGFAELKFLVQIRDKFSGRKRPLKLNYKFLLIFKNFDYRIISKRFNNLL